LAAPSSAALTTAGYAQVGSTGVWNKTFGSIVVSFAIAQGASGSYVTITPTGDVVAADMASALASVASLGYPQIGCQTPSASGVVTPFAVPVCPPVNFEAANGLQSFGMSL